jgi:hypothetical protein
MAAPKTLRKPASHASGKVSVRSLPSPIPPCYPQRRKFLALPLAQRREILKAQAALARGHYTESPEWREWEAADLTSQADE